jgi:general secretion pathway protein D
MKKIILTLIALGVAGLALPAFAQTDTNTPDANNNPPASDVPAANVAPPDVVPPPDAGPDQAPMPADAGTTENARPGSNAILPTQPFAADREKLVSDYVPPATGTNADELRLNFRNAPLEMVLNYLSDAAGFIIVLDTQVRGNVSVISNHTMTRDEAVDLLNEVLNQNGYAAIRNDRTLTILDKNDAKTRDIPVKVSNNPQEIPKTDEIVTQIVPIRFVDAGDLVKDLSSFVSPQATVVANDAGNSIVITDTQSNIRHIVEIIKAIDSSAETETEIRVFRLKYASPTDVATELAGVFPSSTSGNTTQAPTRFGGGGGGGPGGFFARMMAAQGGNGGGNSANSANDRIKKATQVTAVADTRIQAVIVTAPKDMMEEIAEMMRELDVSSDRDQDVYVFHLNNADPYQALSVLQNMFQSSSSSRNNSSSSSSQSPFALRAQNTATTTSTSSSTTSSSFGSGSGAGGRGGQ